MVESSEHRDCVNASLGLRGTWNRLLVRESLVRASFVVETHVLGDDASKMFLANDEDVIEQFSAERARQALSEGIHVRRAYRGANDAHARRREYASEASAELRVVVADKHIWRALHGGVPGLPRAPFVGRRIRDRGVNDLSRRRSRKKSTKTSRNRTSYVWTKSHAHVTWLRKNVDQPWPSPRGLEPRMYR